MIGFKVSGKLQKGTIILNPAIGFLFDVILSGTQNNYLENFRDFQVLMFPCIHSRPALDTGRISLLPVAVG